MSITVLQMNPKKKGLSTKEQLLALSFSGLLAISTISILSLQQEAFAQNGEFPIGWEDGVQGCAANSQVQEDRAYFHSGNVNEGCGSVIAQGTDDSSSAQEGLQKSVARGANSGR